MTSDELYTAAVQVVTRAQERHLSIALAESCTGGMIAAAITEVPGASQVLGYGFVTYSNAAKISLLKVESDMVERHGPCSNEVAQAMARGALQASGANVALATTGEAGPSATQKLGTVFIGYALHGAVHSVEYNFTGTRQQIRYLATVESLLLLLRILR
jgi:nicotinamide-nucleotide amidase